jgi:formate-dependent nitrite reductase membrane component NrfD
MNAEMLPSTLFSAAPHWKWLIIWYFFIGGLAGGTFFLAALLDLLGHVRDRALARLGYLIAFPAVLVCGVLLILDLGRPTRFWHMLIQSNTGWPMFKAYSPMSLGSWALLVFGFFAFLTFLSALGNHELPGERWRIRLRPPGPLGMLVAVCGGIAGLFLSGYTGLLLAATNRPIWSDTTLLGVSFLISAASTSSALLIVLGRRLGGVYALRRLARFEVIVMVLELVALVALVVSLGPLARAWLNVWGVLLVVGVAGLGILAPLVLHWRGGWRAAVAGGVLVLIGGFIFRVVIVLSSEHLGRTI